MAFTELQIKNQAEMNRDFIIRDNAGRLAACLSSFSQDDKTVTVLAQILRYEPQQLKRDMQDIWEIVNSVPKE